MENNLNKDISLKNNKNRTHNYYLYIDYHSFYTYIIKNQKIKSTVLYTKKITFSVEKRQKPSHFIPRKELLLFLQIRLN